MDLDVIYYNSITCGKSVSQADASPLELTITIMLIIFLENTFKPLFKLTKRLIKYIQILIEQLRQVHSLPKIHNTLSLLSV